MLSHSTVTTIRTRIDSTALAAALFYCHPDATALTLVHILTSQPVANTVLMGAIAALRGYRLQDHARVVLLIKVLRDVLDTRKDYGASLTGDANAVTCPEN